MLGVQLLSVTGKAESSQNPVIPVNPASNYLQQNTLCSWFSHTRVPCTHMKNKSTTRIKISLYALLESCSVNRIMLETGCDRDMRTDRQVHTSFHENNLLNS